MKKTIVVYGSSTGTCEAIAQSIAEKLGVDVINVTEMDENTIKEHDNLLLGTATWGEGELQDDWFDGVKVIEEVGLQGKTVALFACGDSENNGETFCGSMSALYKAVTNAGANVLEGVSADDYTFDDSESVINGKFVGLALDEMNEDDKTEPRINAWLEQIKPSL